MRVQLSKSSWHYWLHRRILGTPYFTNLCPYFWLTVFCCFASPFFFGVVALKKSFVKVLSITSSLFPSVFNSLWSILVPIVTFLLRLFESFICEPMDRIVLKLLPEEKVIDYYDHYQESLQANKKSGWHLPYDRDKVERFEAWKTSRADWEKVLEGIKIRHEAHLAYLAQKESEDAARAIRNEKFYRYMLNLIVKYMKYPTFALVGFISFGILYYFVSAVLFVVPLFWEGVIMVWTLLYAALMKTSLLLLLKFFSLAIGICLIVLGVVMIVKASIESSKCKWIRNLFNSGTSYGLIRHTVRVIEGTASFFGFFIEYIKLAKKDYCPGIEWKE